MKQIKTHHLTAASGEKFEIRETANGESVCPICGFVSLGEPAYTSGPKELTTDGAIAFPSHAICSECGVQYGFDDSPDDEKRNGLKEKWAKLTEEWIKRKGGKTEFVKRQLENLE